MALRGNRVGLRVDWVTLMGRCGVLVVAAVIGVGGLVSVPVSMAATPGLVAAYSFDEGSGSTVADASGNGNTGTISGTTWTPSGRYAGALQFDGSSALVTVPDAQSLHLSSGMTLEAWVNPTTLNARWRDVIYKGDDNYYLEAASPNGRRPAAALTADGSSAHVFGTAALRKRWSYLAATYDGSTLRLYVNGTEVASTAQTGTIANSTDPLQIGGDSIYGQYFAGLIDNVRIYNVALSTDQIQADQTTPVTDSGTDVTPPSQPGTLTATAVSDGEIDLSWGASTDDVGLSDYQVERCQGADCTDFTQIATPSGTSYQDTGLNAATSYSYRVRATDAANNQSDYTNTANATTLASDATPPTQPGTLTANVASESEIDLAWGASTGDAGVAGYQLERCQGAGCADFTQIATPTGTSYQDSGLISNTTYSYRVRAVDAGGTTGPYSNTASATTPPATTTGPGPLHVDPTGRFLVDQNGKPFLITGESPQAMIGDLTDSDAALFFANRRAHGFNTVWINLLCNDYTGCRADGSTWDGIPPFTTPGDFSTPNEAYFARADRILRLAAEYGFVVILDPAETGGWLSTMVDNGVDKLRAYGQYLGSRYKDFPNIIWMSGNDYRDWGPTYDPYVTAVAQGIRDADPNQLQTVELIDPATGSLDDAAWAPLIDLNASYTYQPTYQQVLKDYNRSNFLPTFMVEAFYEFEGPATSQLLRQQEYWSLLSGATGQLYGNHFTWQFLCPQRDASGNCLGGWKDELDTPGAEQMANVVALFSPRRWYDLVPDQSHTLVTSGYGTFGQTDYVTAARTPDGKLAMAYLPSGGTVTVDLGTLSGPVTARWYDPTDGTFTTIGGGPLANTGNVTLAAPGINGDGADDWVLVLESP